MDELLGRRTPYSADAEQAVLGSMLIDPACVPNVVGKVRGGDFYIDANRDIFETMFAMFAMGKKIDPLIVLDEMQARKCWKESSPQYLRELMDATPTAANVERYCAIVRDKAMLRALGESAAEITDQVYQQGGQAQEVLELAERKIYALRKESTSGGLIPVTQVLKDVLSQISQAAAGGSQLPGISTGLVDIDECLQGLGEGDLVLIASRPGMGKTSIALNIAVNAAKTSGKTVAIFSLEMSRQQLVQRMLSSESHIDLYQINQGRLSGDEWSRLAEAAGHDRGGDGRPVPPDRGFGPGGGGLPAVDAVRRQRQFLGQREPYPGRQRYQPHDEGHRQGAGGAHRVHEPAQPRQ